jgi:hypothetical protein
MRKRSYHSLGIFALLLSAAALHAEIVGVETFDYPDGPIAARAGGTFWDFKNIAPAGHDGTASDWDNVLGAPTVSASRLSTNNSSAKREFNGPTNGFGVGSDEENGSFTDNPARVNQVLYIRTTFTTGASATLPNFVGFSMQDFGTERIFFGKRNVQSVFGIETFNGFGSVNSTVSVQPNMTYTLVAKVDYPNNSLSLFINPDLNAGEPTPNAALTGYTTNNFSTAVRLGSSPGDPVTWDNLVVATSWEDLGTVVNTNNDEDNGSVIPSAGPGVGVSLREAIKYSPSGTLITFAPTLDGKTITSFNGDFILPSGRQLSIDGSALPHGITIDGNNASRIFSVGSGQALTLHSLTLTGGNSAGSFVNGVGGAIYNAGVLRVISCTLMNNSAADGGALCSFGASAMTVLDRCTISGNSATRGGAIFGLSVISGCTISGNASAIGSGAVATLNSGSAQTRLDHTIVSGNEGGDVVLLNQTDSFLSLDYNLIGTGDSSALDAFNQPHDQTGVTNPKLSPLGYFGGPTMTMHPLVGSPAIDTGGATSSSGVDQRGFPRSVDGDGNATAQLDIGAVEAGPFITVTTQVDENDGAANGAGLSLREALSLATSPGHRILFSTSQFPRRIPLTLGELAINQSQGLFIDASNINGGVTIDGGFGSVGATPSRVFNIGANATVAMQRLAITKAKAPDGVTGGAGDDGTDGADGGGIRNDGALSLILCTITESHAGIGGSAAPNRAGIGGHGGSGGAIFSNGPLSLTACSIGHNAAGAGGFAPHRGTGGGTGGDGGRGGAIFSSGALSVNSCNFVSNQSGTGGDAEISFDGRGGNGGDGGAIFSNSKFDVVSCTVDENQSGKGGQAIAGTGSQTQGGNGGRGGGIFTSGTFSLSSSTLSLNQTGEGGPGSGSSGGGGNGGGIYNAGIFSLLSSTIVENIAGFIGAGGGLFVESGALGSVTHATIVGNLAFTITGPFAGGFYNNNGTLALHYSIVAGNSGDTFGPFTNDTNFIGGDPLLVPLGNYGGVAFTRPPLPGSPVIDAAANSTVPTDERGFNRINNPDIGAAEFQGFEDILRYLPTDWDGDDNAFGIEYALGTDPLTSDRNNARNLTRPTFNAQGQATLTFGRNPNAFGIAWLLQRSTDLVNWTQLYVFDGTNQSFDSSKVSATLGTNSISVTDKQPPSPKAFYRLEVGGL